MSSKYKINYTSNLPALFLENNCSILVSTYQASKVICIGSIDGEELYQIPVSIKKPMGIAQQGDKLAIASLDEITFYSSKENVASTIRLNERNFDKVFLQRASYQTSTLDIHDIHFGKGVLWGVNTLFSCLCTFDVNHNFRPKWKPKFIDALVPEDRCHLNGMAFDDTEGIPAYVTTLGQTNHKDGWRENKMSGGALIEAASGDVILDKLAMPHSPRLIDDELFVLESGAGRLLKVNVEDKSAKLIFDFGCFIRGLNRLGSLLFIGKSQIRKTAKDFQGLDVSKNSTHAGIIVFDLDKREVVGEINYETTVEEIFDIQVIEDSKKPLVLGDHSDNFDKIITFPSNVFWRVDQDK